MVNKNYLELKNISFAYKKDIFVLKNLNVKFISGKIIALLGINGSGKTTLFKILTGIYTQQEGTISYNNTDITSQNIIKFKSELGFMPEYLSLYKNMTVKDVLKLLGSLKGYDVFNIEEILTTVFLIEHSNKKIKALSKGMKQRLNLAQAIIGNPKIILLDEPSNGFDCGSITMFYKILKNLAENGSIILISSHHLTEIYGNVDKVLILSKGQVIKEINIHEFDNENIIYKEIYILLDEKINKLNLDYLYQNFKNININNDLLNLNAKLDSKNIIKLISYLINSNTQIKDIKINDKILEDTLTNLS